MNLAHKIDQARARHVDAPRPRQPELRLVHDADAPTVVQSEPQPGILARVGNAINRTFAFCLVVVVLVSFTIGGYVSGWNDRIMQESRAQAVALLTDHSLPAPLPQIGEFDREKGRAK